MRKQVILSLLTAAAAAPGAVYADVNCNDMLKEGWAQSGSGLTNVDWSTINSDEGLTVPSATNGSIYIQPTLPQGTYTLNFGKRINTKVTITGNNNKTEFENGKVVTFDTDDFGTNPKITFTSEDGVNRFEFRITNLTLETTENVKKLYDELKSVLDNTENWPTLKTAKASTRFKTQKDVDLAKELNETKATLETNKATYDSDVEKLKDGEMFLEDYKNLIGEGKIEEATLKQNIEKLKTDYPAHNIRVANFQLIDKYDVLMAEDINSAKYILGENGNGGTIKNIEGYEEYADVKLTWENYLEDAQKLVDGLQKEYDDASIAPSEMTDSYSTIAELHDKIRQDADTFHFIERYMKWKGNDKSTANSINMTGLWKTFEKVKKALEDEKYQGKPGQATTLKKVEKLYNDAKDAQTVTDGDITTATPENLKASLDIIAQAINDMNRALTDLEAASTDDGKDLLDQISGNVNNDDLLDLLDQAEAKRLELDKKIAEIANLEKLDAEKKQNANSDEYRKNIETYKQQIEILKGEIEKAAVDYTLDTAAKENFQSRIDALKNDINTLKNTEENAIKAQESYNTIAKKIDESLSALANAKQITNYPYIMLGDGDGPKKGAFDGINGEIKDKLNNTLNSAYESLKKNEISDIDVTNDDNFAVGKIENFAKEIKDADTLFNDTLKALLAKIRPEDYTDFVETVEATKKSANYVGGDNAIDEFIKTNLTQLDGQYEGIEGKIDEAYDKLFKSVANGMAEAEKIKSENTSVTKTDIEQLKADFTAAVKVANEAALNKLTNDATEALQKFESAISTNATGNAIASWDALYTEKETELTKEETEMQKRINAYDPFLEKQPKETVKECNDNIERIINTINNTYCGQNDVEGSIAWNELWHTTSVSNYLTTKDAIKSLEDFIDNFEGQDLVVTITDSSNNEIFNGPVSALKTEKCAKLSEEADKQEVIDNENFKKLKAGDLTAGDNKGNWYSDSEEKYENIQETIKAIKDALSTDYQKAVAEANDNLVEKLCNIVDLEAKYRKAVKRYNAFFNTPDKGEYHDQLAQVLLDQRHVAIFEKATPINELKNNLILIKEEALAQNPVTILKEDESPLKEKIASYNEISEFIDNYITELNNAVETEAENYYSSRINAANELLSAFEAFLNEAKIPEEFWDKTLWSKEENKAVTRKCIETATDLYNKVKDNEDYVDGDLSLKIEDVVNPLENVTEDYFNDNANTMAWNAWESLYKTTNQEIADLEKEIAGYEYKNEANATALEEVKTALTELNKEAEKSNKAGVICQAFFSNYSDYEVLSTELEEQREIIKEIKEAANQYNEDQKGYQDQRDAWTEDANELQGKFDKLREDISKLNIDYTALGTGEIADDMAALRAKIEAYTGDTAQETDIDNLKTQITNGIDASYKKAYDEQWKQLKSLIDDIQEVYNNRFAADENASENANLKAMREALDKEVKALAGVTVETGAEAEAYQKAVQGMPEVLQLILSDYETYNVEPDVTDPGIDAKKTAALEALKAVYGNVESEIDAAQETLDNAELYKPTEAGAAMQEQINALRAELDAIKAKYEADKIVVDLQKAYTEDMTEVLNKANEYAEQITAAETQMKTSNAKAEELNKVLTGYLEQLDGLEKLLTDGYEAYNAKQDFWAVYLKHMHDVLGALGEDLEIQKAAYSLTEESVLNPVDVISYEQIFRYVAENAAQAEIKYQTGEAFTAVEINAYSTVFNGRHTYQQELNDKYDSLLFDLQILLNEVNNPETEYDKPEMADPTDTESFVSRAKSIREKANALVAEANENLVIVGSINGDGEVNMGDYRALLTMILDGVLVDQADKTTVAADIDGNGRISVSDLTLLMQLIQESDLNGLSHIRIKAAMPTEGANQLSVSVVSEQQDTRLLAVELTNTTAFAAAQMDVMLPDGMQVVNVYAGDQAGELNLHSNDLGNGRYRVLLENAQGSLTATGQGTLVYLEVTGRGMIGIDNALGADANAHEFDLKAVNVGTSGVTTFTEDLKNGMERIYNAGGQMLNKLQQGVNIIIGKDGKARKIFRKN